MNFADFWNERWSAAFVDHMWQSTLVMFVAWLLAIGLRRNQARTRYWVWMAASVKLLVPFALLSAIGERLRPTSMHLFKPPQITSAFVTMARPFVATAGGAESVSTHLIGRAAVIAPAPHHGSPVIGICVVAWLSGLLFLLLRWSRAWWDIRGIVRSASPISLGMAVSVLLTERMIEPGIVGIFRPVLLLPDKIMDRLSAAQLRTILAHESCHVQRRDNLTAAIHMMVEAVFWFHPGVWWIERRLIEERERACDEAVLQQGNEPETYAESILNVCKFYKEASVPCVSGVTGSELKRRILRIMTKRAMLKLDLKKKVLLGAVAAAGILVPIAVGLFRVTEAHAQSDSASPNSIVATWQGVLHADRDLHFVVKITSRENGGLRGIFYNIDAALGGISAVSTTLKGSLLKLELPFATFEGTLDPDGRRIEGKWTQGQNSLPLTFARATNHTAWTIPQLPPRTTPMAADANPTFEVATIKPSRPDEHGPRYDFRGRRFSVIHASLGDLLKFSYGLQQSQIANAPDWVNSESFDIAAEPDGAGEPSIKQWESMVKKLMSDRFQLKSHFAKREQNVYLLTVAGAGAKLARSQSGPDTPSGMGFGPPGNFGATNVTMAEIASALGQGVLNRPVMDRTELPGRFDLRLTWTPDGSASETGSVDSAPGFFTAIQEQLGLKVVSSKAPVDVLVVDRVEKPSAN